MADIKITDLAAYTDPVSTDVLPIVDVGSDITKKVSIADLLENAGTGSAAAPSFSFDGDNNTGIYRPGADQVAISTNGTGRLFIGDDGRVGIGGTGIGASVFTARAATNQNITIKSFSGEVAFEAINDANNANVPLRYLASQYVFNTGASERLRIDSSGRVGIGTASPSQPLDVVGWVKTSVGLLGTTGRVSTASGGINISTGATANPIIFTGGTGSANVERMRIDTSGNVGIGEDAPISRLHLADSGSGAVIVTFTNDTSGHTSGNGAEFGIGGDEQAQIWNYENSYFRIGTNNSERLRIDSSGRVGIGTSSPSVPLEVLSSSFDSFKVVRTGAGAGAKIGIVNGDGNEFQIIHDGAESLVFRYGSTTERLRIDSSGNVGIGTSSPAAVLTTYAAGFDPSNNTVFDGVGLFLESSVANGDGNYGSALAWNRPGSSANFKCAIAPVQEGADIDLQGLAFFTSNGVFASDDPAERLRIDSSGNVGIGVSTMAGGGSSLSILRSNALRWADSDGTQRADIYGDSSSNLVFRNGTGSTERMRIDSSGLINVTGGIQVTENVTPTAGSGVEIFKVSSTVGQIQAYNRSTSAWMDLILKGETQQFYANTSERMRIDSSGRLLVGTTTEGHTNADNLTLADSGSCGLTLRSATDNFGRIYFSDGTSGDAEYRGMVQYDHTNNRMQFAANASTAMTIDSSGNVGIGTTNPSLFGNSAKLVIQRAGSSESASCVIYGASNASSLIQFADGTGSAAERNAGFIAVNHTDQSMGFGIQDSERMRIDSSGNLLIGTTTASIDDEGHEFRASSFAAHTVSGGVCLRTNRLASDGSLVEFFQATIQEGSISVSGSTVSYNGAHLSRWSQIPGIDPYNKAVRPEILRGTVMSNLDEMCDWACPTSGDCQDNEQLNKTKISDVEGDKNVAGIFQGWDDDDDTWVNDYYLAMTGDFVIRIAAGTTVERGDLLMSAGDGTAKPQDDDIIRSKTIAKVTSTNVSCTYDDGSYCVPCVLMAC